MRKGADTTPMRIEGGMAYATTELVQHNGGFGYPSIHGRVICNDGFSMSVRGSECHYCHPRDNSGRYYDVEVGYPDTKPEPWEQWEKYCESPDCPTGTVYGYVPVILVEELIKLHGGIRDKQETALIDGAW